MTDVFFLLFLLVLVSFIWSLVSPKGWAKKARLKQELTRQKTSTIFIPALILLLILVGATAPKTKTINLADSSGPQNTSKTTQPKVSSPTITIKQETETESVPYKTENQNDSNLDSGQTMVAQTGQNGTETLTYNVTYTNGKQTSKVLASTTVTTQPVNQIVDIGTYTPPTPSTSTTQSCYPETSGGNCYEPGEYCSDADHGMSGVAGDGKTITCLDNNGWRWEPQ